MAILFRALQRARTDKDEVRRSHAEARQEHQDVHGDAASVAKRVLGCMRACANSTACTQCISHADFTDCAPRACDSYQCRRR